MLPSRMRAATRTASRRSPRHRRSTRGATHGDRRGRARVGLEGPPRAPWEGRPLALKRALRNLVENAVNYGGHADLRVVVTPIDIIITVEDDGPGIPEAAIEKVFMPFYRLERSRSRATGGVGLGLAVARPRSVSMEATSPWRTGPRGDCGRRWSCPEDSALAPYSAHGRWSPSVQISRDGRADRLGRRVRAPATEAEPGGSHLRRV